MRKDIPFVATIDIGPLKFALVFEQSKENEGSYRIYDFFTKEQKVAFENENDPHFSVFNNPGEGYDYS